MDSPLLLLLYLSLSFFFSSSSSRKKKKAARTREKTADTNRRGRRSTCFSRRRQKSFVVESREIDPRENVERKIARVFFLSKHKTTTTKRTIKKNMCRQKKFEILVFFSPLHLSPRAASEYSKMSTQRILEYEERVEEVLLREKTTKTTKKTKTTTTTTRRRRVVKNA